MDRRSFIKLMAGSMMYSSLPATGLPLALSSPGETPQIKPRPTIKVLGIGTAGANLIERMISSPTCNIEGYVFVGSSSRTSHLPSTSVTMLPPAHGDADSATEERRKFGGVHRNDIESISQAIGNPDLLFVVGALGSRDLLAFGETVAHITKQAEILTIGLFSMPFRFEGPRCRQARVALARIQPQLNSTVLYDQDYFRWLKTDLEIHNVRDYCDGMVEKSIDVLGSMYVASRLSGQHFAETQKFLQVARVCQIGWGEASRGQPLWTAAAHAAIHPLYFQDYPSAQRMLISISAGQETFESEGFRSHVANTRTYMSDKPHIRVCEHRDDDLKPGMTRQIVLASVQSPSRQTHGIARQV